MVAGLRRAAGKTEGVEPIRVDRAIAEDIGIVSTPYSANPGPGPGRRPRAERFRQRVRPAPSPSPDQCLRGAPPPYPLSSPEQLRQESHPVVAQSEVSQRAAEENRELPLLGRFDDAVLQGKIADGEHRPLGQ